MQHDFPENVESVPAFLCMYCFVWLSYGKNDEVTLTRKGLSVLETYAEIESLKFMEGGALIRLGELSEPLPIIKARMSEASEEEIDEMKKENELYWQKVSKTDGVFVESESAIWLYLIYACFIYPQKLSSNYYWLIRITQKLSSILFSYVTFLTVWSVAR